MQHRERCARETRREAPDELRREADLGHQHQHAAVAGEMPLGQPEIDLGLAAAGDAVQQPAVVAAVIRGLERIERGSLRGVGRGHGGRDRRSRLRSGLHRAVRRFREGREILVACDPAAREQGLGGIAPSGQSGVQGRGIHRRGRSAVRWRERLQQLALARRTAGFAGGPRCRTRRCVRPPLDGLAQRRALPSEPRQSGGDRLTDRVMVVVGRPHQQFQQVGIEGRYRVDGLRNRLQFRYIEA